MKTHPSSLEKLHLTKHWKHLMKWLLREWSSTYHHLLVLLRNRWVWLSLENFTQSQNKTKELENWSRTSHKKPYRMNSRVRGMKNKSSKLGWKEICIWFRKRTSLASLSNSISMGRLMNRYSVSCIRSTFQVKNEMNGGITQLPI